jgi:hypothetical protein
MQWPVRLNGSAAGGTSNVIFVSTAHSVRFNCNPVTHETVAVASRE